jgi:hypothetical protein
MRDDGGMARPPLVIGCGALAAELVELTRRAGLPAMDLTCLPASLHNRPERIPGAVARRIRRARADGYERIFVAYADCGTGGMLDRVLQAEGVARLEGAHCYEVYAGRAAFAALHDAEPGTFYLTDFLARNFERLVIRGLGLDRYPELLPAYFGNYRRLVYLAQTDDPTLTARAKAAAGRLGLAFERRFVGLVELAPAIARFAAGWDGGAGAAMTDADAPAISQAHERAAERVPRRDSMKLAHRSGRTMILAHGMGRESRSSTATHEPRPSAGRRQRRNARPANHGAAPVHASARQAS